MPVRIASDRARQLAGDPTLIVLGRGDFPVERHRGLHRHQGQSGAHEVKESLVQLRGARSVTLSDFDFDAGVAKLCESSAAHLRVGIFQRRDHLLNPGGEDSLGAWRSASMKGVRLERHIHGRAARSFAGLLDGQDFGMFHAFRGIEPAADHLAIANNHRAYRRIGRGAADAACSQFQGLVQILVHRLFDNQSKIEATKISGSNGSRSSSCSPTPT
jgi:hypothetical protein